MTRCVVCPAARRRPKVYIAWMVLGIVLTLVVEAAIAVIGGLT